MDRTRMRRMLGIVVALTVATSALIGTTPARATTRDGTYRAEAYGSFAFVGDVVIAGKTGRSAMGCTLDVPHHTDNATAGVNLPGLLTLGAVHSYNDTFHVAGGTSGRSTAETTGVNLLGGVITASAVKAVAQTTWNGIRYRNSGVGSALANVAINGEPLDVAPPPNTRIDLPGIGYVILNEQISKSASTSQGWMITNAIHVVITALDNALGLKRGTQIIVSHAEIISRAVTGPLTGAAYSSQVLVGNVARSEPTTIVWVQCVGTNGQLLTNQVAGIDLPGLLQTGTATSTVRSQVQPFIKADTTSTVKAVNLLNGLVSATVTKAAASLTKSGATPTFSTAGTKFLELNVQGFPQITDTVAPNTSIDIPGLGTLWFRRVIRTPKSVEVRMIELVVNDPNASANAEQRYGAEGIEPGMTIQVAVAWVALR